MSTIKNDFSHSAFYWNIASDDIIKVKSAIEEIE